MQVHECWSGLSAIEKKYPVSKAKYATANRTLEAAGNVLNTLNGALDDEKTTTVQYALNKRVKAK